MKKTIITTAVLFSLGLFASNGMAAKKSKGKLKSQKDKLSYSIGVSMAQGIIPIKEEINLDQFLKGLSDNFYGGKIKISDREAEALLNEFSMKMQKKMDEKTKVIAQNNLIEGGNFLKKNKEKEGVTTTQSGLQYTILKQGDGLKPTNANKVKVNYRGTTINGVEFDSSYKRGEPVIFPVTGVIKGWTEALLLMNVGSKYKLFVPAELAYGAKGASPIIAPNAVLVFEVELLGIEK